MICFAYIVIALSGAWLLGYGFHFDPARIMHAIKHDKFAQTQSLRSFAKKQ